MCKTRFDSQGMILNIFCKKNHFPKYVNGMQNPPPYQFVRFKYTCLNKAFLTTFSSRNSLEVKFVLVLVDLVRQIPFLPVFFFLSLVLNLTDLKNFNLSLKNTPGIESRNQIII